MRSKSKEDKRISIVDGALRIKNPANKLEADLGSDLLLKYALTRRGLALDQANVVAFRLHDAWVERLMEVRHTAPPAGYIAVSHQILNADGKLFVKLAEATRSGVQLQASGRPIDNVWRATRATILMWRISCNHFLNLLLRGQILTHTQVHPYGGGKGKQKGGKRTGLTSLPAALRDHGTAVTSQGHALCFGHSLKNCKAVVQKGFICAAKDVSELIPIRTALSLRMPSLQSDHRLRRL